MSFEERTIKKLGAFLPTQERELLREQLKERKDFKMKLYTTKDKISEKFNNLFMANNHAEATRNWSIGVADTNSMLNKRPQDYELWYVGEYNLDNGEITQEEKYVIAQAQEFANPTLNNTTSSNS